MSAISHREHRPLMDLLDWVESPLTMFRTFPAQPMRIESFTREGKYVVRAELPGLDPEHDIDVSVADGILRIHAERKEEKTDKTHAEFRYGEFTRHAVLPAGADESAVTASYDKGILDVEVALRDPEAAKRQRQVPIKIPKPHK